MENLLDDATALIHLYKKKVFVVGFYEYGIFGVPVRKGKLKNSGYDLKTKLTNLKLQSLVGAKLLLAIYRNARLNDLPRQFYVLSGETIITVTMFTLLVKQ